MSRRAEAKEARRKKRRAARDARWIPDDVLSDVVDSLDLADDLADFDERISERGWLFSDEFSDDNSALWFYPPSLAETTEDDVTPITTAVMFADDNAEIVHVLFAGAQNGYQFTTDELFDYLDTIEGYRLGDPLPEF